MYKCDICDFSTDRINNLKAHERTVKHIKNTELSQVKTQTDNAIANIINNDVCTTAIDNNTVKMNDEQLTDNNDDSQCNTYECVCTKTFNDTKSVWAHKNICTVLKKLPKNLPKNTVLSETTIASTTNEILLNSFGLIYLIQPKEFLNTDIYKVGMSSKMNLSRIQVQGCKSRCLFVMECVMAHKLESTIKTIFKQKFTLYKGSEYFKGNELVMTDEFMSLCIEHKLKYRLDKFKIAKQSDNLIVIKDECDIVKIKPNKNSDIEKNPTKVYRCNCKKTFSCYQNLWRHRNKCDGIETKSNSLEKTQKNLIKSINSS